MTNTSKTSKIIAIISAVLIVIGMALGTVFHFVSGNFYNYGDEYSSYKTVTVNWYYADFGAEAEVEEICLEAFKAEGISGQKSHNTGYREQIVFRFSMDTADEALVKATEAINQTIASSFNEDDMPLTYAVWHTEEALLGGGYVMMFASIALATIVAIQLIYTVIRFKLSAMLTAFAADLHNIALFAAILAITRVPVTSSVLVYAVLLILVTAIGVTFTLERIKRNLKDEDNAKLSAQEITNKSAAETFKANIALPAFLAIVALLGAIFTAVSALSVAAILSPVLCALLAFIVCVYGNVLFVPAIYPTLRGLCGKIKFANPSKKKGK